MWSSWKRHNAHGNNPLVEIYGFRHDSYSVGILGFFFSPKLSIQSQTGNPSHGTFVCVSLAAEMRLNVKLLLGVSL